MNDKVLIAVELLDQADELLVRFCKISFVLDEDQQKEFRDLQTKVLLARKRAEQFESGWSSEVARVGETIAELVKSVLCHTKFKVLQKLLEISESLRRLEMAEVAAEPEEDVRASIDFKRPIEPTGETVDFVSLSGPMVVYYSGEARDCILCESGEQVVQFLCQEGFGPDALNSVESREWILKELSNPDMWMFDQDDRPFIWSLPCGEISEVTVIARVRAREEVLEQEFANTCERLANKYERDPDTKNLVSSIRLHGLMILSLARVLKLR